MKERFGRSIVARSSSLNAMTLWRVFGVAALVFGFAFPKPLEAQLEMLPQTGINANTPYQHTDIDSVDLSSGNVNVHIPLVSFPQLGEALKLNFIVRFNEPQWTYVLISTPQAVQGGYDGTWELAQKTSTAIPASDPLGVDVVRDQGITVRTNILNFPCIFQSQLTDCSGGPSGSPAGTTGNDTTVAESVTLRDRSGAVHPLLFSDAGLSGAGHPVTISPDGSGWLPQGYNGSPTLLSVTDRQGLKYTPVNISQGAGTRVGWNVTDLHGNQIVTTGNGWTDSVGRQISGTWGGPEDDPDPGVPTGDLSSCDAPTSSARSWTVPGKSQPYVFCYTNLSGKTAFNVQTMLGRPAGGEEGTWGAALLTQIVLPNRQSYRFTYDSQFADLTGITLPTGGYIHYAWQNIAIDCSYTNPVKRVIQSRTVYDGSQSAVTNYSWNLETGCLGTNSTVLISKPDGNDEWHSNVFSSSNAQSTVKYFQGRVSSGGVQSPQGTIAKQEVTNYTIFFSTLYAPQMVVGVPGDTQGNVQTIGGGPEFFQGPPTKKVTTLEDGSVTETDWTLVPNGGLVTYDNPTINLLFEYPQGQSTNCYCINYPEVQSEVVHAYGAGSAGAPLKTTTTNYAFTGDATNLIDLPSSISIADGSGPLANTNFTYDEPTYSPGNRQGDLTTVMKSIDASNSISTHTSYNSAGMVTATWDGKENKTSINAYQCSGLFPQTVFLASGTSMQETQSYGYDCNTGQVTSYTDPNSALTTYRYSDPLNRLTNVSYPDGGSSSASYTDGASSSATFTRTMNGQQSVVQMATYDGLGRTKQTSTTGGATVFTMYDQSGRVSATSMPSFATPNQWTSYTYDVLGRVVLVCNPDNGTSAGSCAPGSSYLEKYYSGPTTLAYDERRNMRSLVSDSLGNLTSVTESTGAVTSYTYSGVGNLLKVSQSGVAGDTARTRSFAYDWSSRLIASHNPEQGTGLTCAGANGSTWSTCYGYDANGNLQSKKDARGITAQSFYDSLNRPTYRTYSDGTPTECWNYDNAGNGIGRPGQRWTQTSTCGTTPGTNALTSVTVSQYDALGRIKTAKQCVLTICTNDNALSFGYDWAGNLTSYNVPTARDLMTIGIGYNNAGWAYSFNQNVAGSTNAAASLLNISAFSESGSLKTATAGSKLSIGKTYDSRLRPSSEVVNVQ